MRPTLRRRLLLALPFLSAPWGCGGADRPAASPTAAVVTDDAEARAEIQKALDKIINEQSIRYRPLDYDYDEDLLAILDRIESSDEPDRRYMPRLDEDEERDHFRESLRRWRARTGKDPRALIGPLKAEVATHKAGEPYHPEFHRRFSAAFDDFIPVEVAEIRERRNRAIHREARPLLDKYRASHPALVREFEDLLNAPPYNPPPPPGPAPGREAGAADGSGGAAAKS